MYVWHHHSNTLQLLGSRQKRVCYRWRGIVHRQMCYAIYMYAYGTYMYVVQWNWQILNWRNVYIGSIQYSIRHYACITSVMHCILALTEEHYWMRTWWDARLKVSSNFRTVIQASFDQLSTSTSKRWRWSCRSWMAGLTKLMSSKCIYLVSIQSAHAKWQGYLQQCTSHTCFSLVKCD